MDIRKITLTELFTEYESAQSQYYSLLHGRTVQTAAEALLVNNAMRQMTELRNELLARLEETK